MVSPTSSSPISNNGHVGLPHTEETEASSSSRPPPPPAHRDPSVPPLINRPNAGGTMQAFLRSSPISSSSSSSSSSSHHAASTNTGDNGSISESESNYFTADEGEDDDDDESLSGSEQSFQTAIDPDEEPDMHLGNLFDPSGQHPQHQPPAPPPGPGAPPGAMALGQPPALPQRFSPAEPVPLTASVATYGASGGTRMGVQSNDGLNHLPSPLNLSTHGDQAAFASSLSGTIGTDLFAGIDTFLTVQSALSDRKNKKAAQEFTQNPDNVREYINRKQILNSYKAAESNPNAAAPREKLSAADVKFVRDFEELQEVAKGNKKLKQMTRFRDLGVQPTAALYNTSVSIAHMATSAAPSALGYGTSGLGLVSGPINIIAGSVETKDAVKNHGNAKEVLQQAAQIGGTGKMETLIRDQYTQLATAKAKKSREDGFHGVSRAVNGTTGTVTAGLAIASVATGAATMGIGAAIAGGVVGGYFAGTYTRKVIKGKRLEKSDKRDQDVAQKFIEQNKGAPNRNANSARAFWGVKNAYAQTQNTDATNIQVPSRKWHGKIKTARDGTTPMSDKPITGTHINNSRYIKEYIAAGHIAKFLEENPHPLQAMQPTNNSDPGGGAEVMLGRKYIEDLKKVVPEAKVDELISKARATTSFEERMEILTKGLHELSNI